MPIVKDSIDKSLIAENNGKEHFRELPRFEVLINQEYRSEDVVEVTTPKLAQKYSTGDAIVFRWQKQGISWLNLVIFNNKGKVISEQQIPISFTYKKVLSPGLYYWQLETNSEEVYVGKFRVE